MGWVGIENIILTNLLIIVNMLAVRATDIEEFAWPDAKEATTRARVGGDPTPNHRHNELVTRYENSVLNG